MTKIRFYAKREVVLERYSNEARELERAVSQLMKRKDDSRLISTPSLDQDISVMRARLEKALAKLRLISSHSPPEIMVEFEEA